MEDGTGAPSLVPRCCHVVRWPHFTGYGFNLHAEKGKAGQYIGKVDPNSPAEAAGLRHGDRIVEVNGINIGNENHKQVVARIKSEGDEARLLVVDAETDLHYKNSITVVKGDLPEVRFITSKRGDEIDSAPNTNGSAFTTSNPPAASEPPASGYSTPPPQQQEEEPRDVTSPYHLVRLCKLCKWDDFDGYGFNLHAEKDKPGQYIGAVDEASPAATGGLKDGDRIVEVNGENIEGMNHPAVIQRVKAGGDRTVLLVVDREADAYYQGQGLSVSSQLPGVTVIVTPPTSKGNVVDINSNEQSSQPEPSLTTFTPSEEPTSYSVEKSQEAEVAAPAAKTDVAAPPAAETEVVAPPAAETKVTNAEEEDVNLSTLPEPNVSLSDEESEVITAVTADAVESTPEPPAPFDEETVPNGHQVEKEEEEDREEEEKKEEEEEHVAVVTSTIDVTQPDDVVVGDDVEDKREEEEEQEEEGGEGMNDYEEVEMVKATVAVAAYSAPPPAVEDRAEEDLGNREEGAEVAQQQEEEKAANEILEAVASEPDTEEPPQQQNNLHHLTEDDEPADDIANASDKATGLQDEVAQEDAATPKEAVVPDQSYPLAVAVVIEETTGEEAAPNESRRVESSPVESSPAADSSPADSSPADSSPAENRPASPKEEVPVEGSPADVVLGEPIKAETAAAAAAAAAAGREVNGMEPAEEVSGVPSEVKDVKEEDSRTEPESPWQLSNGAVSYGINGGAEVPEPEPEPEAEPEPEPRRVEPEPVRAPAPISTPMPIAKAPEPEPEPEAAVIRSTAPSANSKPPTPSGPAMGGDLHLFMSAAEMKERLKARKKQDPRFHKTSFEAKSKMFEKL